MKKIILSVICFAISLGLYGYYYIGKAINTSISQSLRDADIPFSESTTLMGKLAVPGAILFLVIGILLVAGRWLRAKLDQFSRSRGDH